MSICLDTSAIIYYLQGDRVVTKIIDSTPELYAPSIVVLEALHVVRRVHLRLRRKPNYQPLLDFLEEIAILPIEPIDAAKVVETMEAYDLSSNDAVIALTCKGHGIDTIVTLDEDFKRVPWLKKVPKRSERES